MIGASRRRVTFCCKRKRDETLKYEKSDVIFCDVQYKVYRIYFFLRFIPRAVIILCGRYSRIGTYILYTNIPFRGRIYALLRYRDRRENRIFRAHLKKFDYII